MIQLIWTISEQILPIYLKDYYLEMSSLKKEAVHLPEFITQVKIYINI